MDINGDCPFCNTENEFVADTENGHLEGEIEDGWQGVATCSHCGAELSVCVEINCHVHAHTLPEKTDAIDMEEA